MILSLALGLLVPVLLVVGVVWVVRRAGLGRAADGAGAPVPVQDTGRLILYLAALAALMVVLFAIMGLISIVLAETVFSSHNIVGASDAREQISYYLAALIVAFPVWLLCWRAIGHRIERNEAERQAPERRLFFALIFGVTAVASLFAVHTILRVLFTLAGPHDATASLRDGVQNLIQLLVYGTALAVSTRIAWQERGITERDPARDLALVVVTGFGLAFLCIGAINGMVVLLQDVFRLKHELVLGGTPGSVATTWGEIAAWIVSGAVTWAVLTYLDGHYAGVRAFRIPFIYLVLVVAVPAAVEGAGSILYELLRRLFGYRPDVMWEFMPPPLATLLVMGAVWLYYWTVLRRQESLAGPEGPPETMPWPQRPYLYGLAFLGLALATPGAIALLWLIPDAFLRTHATFDAGSWWRDQMSVGISLLFVGGALWSRPWFIVHSAASVDPRERSTESRRRYLVAVLAIAASAGTGFLIAFLWLVLRMLLGGPHGAGTIDDMLRYAATASVVGALAWYHGTLLRADLRSAAGRLARVRIVALVSPHARETAVALGRTLGSRVQIHGYLEMEDVPDAMDLGGLEARIRALAEGGATRILLVLGRKGGTVYPYRQGLAGGAVRSADGGTPLAAPPPAPHRA